MSDQQTLTVQILAIAAGLLHQDATRTHPIGGHHVDRCMTTGLRDQAVRDAAGAVLDRVPDRRLRNAVHDAVHTLLPPVTGTITDYVTQLRTAAVQAHPTPKQKGDGR